MQNRFGGRAGLWLISMFATAASTVIAFGAETAAAAKPGPHIRFDSVVHDFGKLPAGEIAKHSFIFTNTGTSRLEITDVHPGCGCTTAGEWDKSVEPGKTGKIPLQFNSAGFGGMVTKSATVTCNDTDQSVFTLQLTGTVWKPIDITPSMAIFNIPSDVDAPQTRSIRIVNNMERPITLSDVQCPNKQFEVELKTLAPGKEFEVQVTARPPFTGANVMAPITAKTSYEKMPTLNLNAYLMIQQPVLVMPGQIILSGPVTNSNPFVVTIRNQSTNHLEVSDAKSTVEGAQVKVSEAQPGRIINLSVTLPAGFQLKPGEKANVTARTSNPRFPNITIPIFQVPPRPVAPLTAPTVAVGPVVPKARSLSSRTSTNQPATK